MKTLPSNTIIRFADSVEGIPVAVRIYGAKPPKGKLTVKQNGTQAAVICEGKVVAHMTMQDEYDELFISNMKSAEVVEGGCILIDCQPKGKEAKEIPAMGSVVPEEKGEVPTMEGNTESVEGATVLQAGDLK